MTRSLSSWLVVEVVREPEGDVEARSGQGPRSSSRRRPPPRRASQPLRSAYISTVIAVQAASDAAEEAGGGGAGVGAAGALGLVDDERVPALDLDVVGVALAPAGDDPHRLSRPCRARRTARDRRRRRSAPSRTARSEARLRKRRRSSEASSPAWLSATTRRSARRTIVRATSSCAESVRAAGDDELRRQVDPVHVLVDQRLELVGHLGGDAADPVLQALGRLGRGRQLGAGDEQLVLDAQDVGGELGVVAGRASGRRPGRSSPRRAFRRRRCGRRPSRRARRTRARWSRRRPSGVDPRHRREATSASGLKTSPVRSLGKK